MQQFCARAYGPLFTAGMRFWQLGESHYWGHNAILRMAPFIEHCALAPIAGSGSLSGDILSHDFVEAALMRRAGWKVWVADELDGSYEQVPPNLLAELQRDRRWCHGNLQNSRLMFEPGPARGASHGLPHRRAGLRLVAALARLPAALDPAVRAAGRQSSRPTSSSPTSCSRSGRPPTSKLMLTLFGLTAVLLLAPKVLSLVAIVVRGEARRFGGTRRLIGSALVEFAHSLLLAPVRMLFHTQFVLAALTGWRLDWKSPPRDDASTGWREAVSRHGAHTLLAVLWIVAIVVSSETFAWWLTPILLGLLAAMPLSVWGSRVAAGRALRRRGLLLTPEEIRQPRVLAAADRQADLVAQRLATFKAAVGDAEVHERVVAASPRRGEAAGPKAAAEAARVERALREGPDALSTDDRFRLLSSPQALSALRAEVVAHRAHPAWWQAPQAGIRPSPDRRARARCRGRARRGPLTVSGGFG